MKWHTALIDKIKKLKHINSLQALREERGAIFVLTALMLPILLGALGFAYDAGNIYIHRARLQNVTDAAALAGGDLFRNPPNKTAVTEEGETFENGVVMKDGQVVKLKQNVDHKVGKEIYSQETNGIKVTTNSPNHREADAVAQAFIDKNSISLHNDIKTEELSALYYGGTTKTIVNGETKENEQTKIKTTVNTETTETQDGIYYRVIASEKVPLYFLPIILDQHEQEVKTTSVAILETKSMSGKEITITEKPGTGQPTPSKTILDNLFTFSQKLSVTQKLQNYSRDGLSGSNIQVGSTFEGDIYYTTGSATFPESSEAFRFYKQMFFNRDAKNQPKKAADEMDQYGYFARKDTGIKFDSNEYITAFTKMFSDTNASNILYLPTETGNPNQKYDDSKDITSQLVKDSGKSIIVYRGGNSKKLIIDGSFSSNDADKNKPIYIMFSENRYNSTSGNSEGTRDEIHIDVNKNKDNVRPIVFVFLGKYDNSTSAPLVTISGEGTFRGVVYAPYAEIEFHSNITFEGNVIAQNIEVYNQGSYKKVNYFEDKTDPDNPFKDLAVINSGSSSGMTQEDFDNGMKAVVDYLASDNSNGTERDGLDKKYYKWLSDHINDPNILEGLQDDQDKEEEKRDENGQYLGKEWIAPSKKKLYWAWQNAFEYATENTFPREYGDFQLADLNSINKLPWDGFTPIGSGPSVERKEKDLSFPPPTTDFRLINPRTETNPYFKDDDI